MTCESGETYRVEGLQDAYNLGMDFNNAHVQPTGEYHYHGVSDLMVDVFESDEDLVHVGFAADGFLMYYSKSPAYKPGYTLSTKARTGTGCTGSGALRGASVDIEGTKPDGTYVSDWVFDEEAGDLDSCNGTKINGDYAYIITETYPYVGRCLNGEVSEDAGAHHRAAEHPVDRGRGPAGHHRPADLSSLALAVAGYFQLPGLVLEGPH